MKKVLLYLVFIPVLLLSACKPNETLDDYEAGAQANAVPLGVSDNSVAVCTAQSTEAVDLAQPGDWVIGPEDYSVTLVEYADFQCPHCAALEPILKQLQADFPDDLRIIFRHFPLSGHDKANLASQAAEAAGRQEMFWEMHDLLFETQPEWAELTPAEFESWVVEQAAGLGLDPDQFVEDMNSPELVAFAEEAYQHGLEMGLPGTPYLLMNGESLPATFYGYEPLSLNLKYYAIPLGRLANHQFSECPEITIDPDKQYIATLHTEVGDVVIALYADVAPFAVNNFIFLAEHDYYDNVTFHRVIPGFMAQGGDPSGTGLGSPGYFFSVEISPDLTFNREGIVAMANAGPTANGSQFFITYGPAEHLNGGFTIFGEVLEGMDVIEQFIPRDPDANPFADPGTLILDVTIEEK